MITNKKFIGLYVALFLTIVFLLFLVLFGFDIDFSFIGLENNKELKSTVLITSIEGNETFYMQKGKINRQLLYNDEIKKCLRIWPQDNDTEGFFVAKIRKS